MKRTVLSAALAAAWFLSAGATAATFTYHGSLQDAGKAAEGDYDLELTLYSAAEGGKAIAGPLTMYKVPVHDGTFSTEAQFGSIANAPGQAWLGVKLRKAGQGEFAGLGVRAPVGADVTATSTSCPGSWSLFGNAGNPTGSYIGTADNIPLDFKANGLRVGEISPTVSTHAPNINMGSPVNTIQSGSFGATISGGGRTGVNCGNAGDQPCLNQAASNYATVAGGSGNSAVAQGASVGGGDANTADGTFSVVPGGRDNRASGYASFAAGFFASALHDRAFVWSEGVPFSSTGVSQFDVHAVGGVGINTATGPSGSPLGGTELTIASTGGDGHQTWLDMLSRSSSSSSYRGFGFASAPDGMFYLNALSYNGSSTVRTPIIQLQAGVGGGVGINEAPTGANLSIGIAPGDVSENVSIGLDGIKSWSLGLASDGSFYLYDGSDGTFPLQGYSNGIEISNLTVDGNASKPGGGSWLATSDRRIKQDIVPIENAVDTLLKLKPVSFRYVPEYRAMEHNLPDKAYLGFVAQEYASVFPEAVSETDKAVPGAARSEQNILALDPNPALITTVAAVQELAAENAALRERVERLAERLDKLETAKGK